MSATGTRLLLLAANLLLVIGVALGQPWVFLTDPREQPDFIRVPLVDHEKIEVRDDVKRKGVEDYAVIHQVLGFVPPAPARPVVTSTEPKTPAKPPRSRIEEVFEVLVVTVSKRFRSCILKRKRGGGQQSQAGPGDELDGFTLQDIELTESDPEAYELTFREKSNGEVHRLKFQPGA